MRTIALALSLTLLEACTSPQAPVTATSTPAPVVHDDRLDITEQVFRSLLGKNESTDTDNGKPVVLCRSEQRSFDDAFMARFQDFGKRVHRCDDGKVGTLANAKFPEFQLRANNAPAFKFTIGDIELTSPTRATAKAEYYEAALSAGGWTFELEKTDAGWVITKRGMDWIS